MTDRKAELEAVKALPVWKTKEKSLLAYQKKLAMILTAAYLIQGDTQEGESLI